MELACEAMMYEWGRIGPDSSIYNILKKSGCKSELDPNKPYAELWMGDHAKAPSLTKNRRRISDEPILGKINYLFKLLSIHKPLSIQIHPSKEHAEILHRKNSDLYPDDNHKPEMALFKTECALFYGFRPLGQIIKFLEKVHLLRKLCGEQNSERFVSVPSTNSLRKLVKHMFDQSNKIKNDLVEKLYVMYDNNELELDENEKLAFTHVRTSFPGDFGIFFVFLLNIVRGGPGEAVYIPNGILHAYICGELYEAMAVSDNVIRGGMTPKHIDVKEFFNAVIFETRQPMYITPYEVGMRLRYKPPIDEFSIDVVNLEGGESTSFCYPNTSIALVSLGSGSINGTDAKEGHIYANPKGTISIEAYEKSQFIICY